MPTVKAQTFRAGSGHHEMCHARRKYLEKGSRAIERVCLNITDSDRWDREMDKTREAYGLRGCVNYREFIISPDESDHATVDQVKDLAIRWVQENFPTAEAAIVMHDDNKERLATGKEGIVHAHVVVNTVDLATGKKVVVKDSAVRELHNSAQRIAREAGLSELPMYEPGKRLQSAQPRQRTQAERRMEIRGVDAWKSQVRDMAMQALALSDDVGQFREALDAADVDVFVERGRIYLADRDNPDMRCRADRLDKSLSAKSMASHFANRQGISEKRDGLVVALKEELAQGDRIHSEMRDFDRKFTNAVEEYDAYVRKNQGLTSDRLADLLMPDGGTPAEIERMGQLSAALRNAQRQIQEKYNIQDPPRRRWREQGQGGHGDARATQTQHRQRERDSSRGHGHER